MQFLVINEPRKPTGLRGKQEEFAGTAGGAFHITAARCEPGIGCKGSDPGARRSIGLVLGESLSDAKHFRGVRTLQ